jgi:hypothetical protein
MATGLHIEKSPVGADAGIDDHYVDRSRGEVGESATKKESGVSQVLRRHAMTEVE